MTTSCCRHSVCSGAGRSPAISARSRKSPITRRTPSPRFPAARDQFSHTWTWDNTDVRFANTASIGPLDVIYGITANNNPTVQDLWNTTPAWTFPYAVSHVSDRHHSAATLIEGAFAAHVGGVGAYTMHQRPALSRSHRLQDAGLRPAECAGHRSIWRAGPVGRRRALLARRARAALGPHSLMVGTFGMIAEVHPWIDTSFVTFRTTGLSDVGQVHRCRLRLAVPVSGRQFLADACAAATFANSSGSMPALQLCASSNPTNLLNTLRLQASVALGGDNRFVLTGQYFNVWGTSDATLFGPIRHRRCADAQ